MSVVEPAVTLRPLGSRILAAGIWGVSAASLAMAARADPAGLVRLAPFMLLISWIGYLALWRPMVRVDDTGVELVNVLRRIRVPYPALRRIETRWALTLFTDDARYVAWAATASPRRRTTIDRHTGRHAAGLGGFGGTADAAGTGDMTGPGASIPSSADPESASGAAALAILARWRPELSGSAPQPRQRWDRPGLAILLILVLACALAALF